MGFPEEVMLLLRASEKFGVGFVEMRAGADELVKLEWRFVGKDFLIYFRKTQGFLSFVVDLGSFEWCIRLFCRLFHLNRKGVWELRTSSSVRGLRIYQRWCGSFCRSGGKLCCTNVASSFGGISWMRVKLEGWRVLGWEWSWNNILIWKLSLFIIPFREEDT